MSEVVASVKALLRKNGKYLFLREPLHHGESWELPGGKIKYGEEPEQALIREVKEEVNVNIRVLDSVGVWWFYSQKHNHQVICSTYICELAGDDAIDISKRVSDEQFTEYRWLTLSEVLGDEQYILVPSLRKLLQKIKLLSRSEKSA